MTKRVDTGSVAPLLSITIAYFRRRNKVVACHCRRGHDHLVLPTLRVEAHSATQTSAPYHHKSRSPRKLKYITALLRDLYGSPFCSRTVVYVRWRDAVCGSKDPMRGHNFQICQIRRRVIAAPRVRRPTRGVAMLQSRQAPENLPQRKRSRLIQRTKI